MATSLKIEKLVYGGRGAGFLDGMAVFVPMTVPGDEIELEIKNKKKGFAEGDMRKLVKASPNRVTPKCPYFGRCGGCQWQHIDYAAQILWKQIILEEQLVRIGKIRSPRVLPTIPSPKTWGYRNRVRLHKDGDKIGFFAQGTNDIVDIKECLICEKSIEQMQDRKGSEIFSQVNTEQNLALREIVARLVGAAKPKTVLELYCGSGNLTFDIASECDKVLATDADEKAIANAVKLAEKNSSTCIDFQAKSAKKTCDELVKAKKRFDCVVLDPPRDGCKEVTKQIGKLVTKTVIYVSCNPSTLARDAKDLADAGFKLVHSQPIDMFPQTYHIESISLFTRNIERRR